MLKRLKIKFICINMLLVTVLLLLIFFFVFMMTRISLERDSIRMMEAIPFSQKDHRFPGNPPGEIRLPYFILRENKDHTLDAFGSSSFDLEDTAFLQLLLDKTEQYDANKGVLRDYSLRFLRKSTPVGEEFIYVDISSEQAVLRSLIKTCFLIGAATWAAFFLISILLARWAVKPVEQAWTQQKQFVADASHELKTPLTVILTNAELLQSDSYSPDQRQQFSGSILTMSRQMRGLVESLLNLARVDSAQQHPSMTSLDLSLTVFDALLPFEALFFEKDLMLETSIEENIHVKGCEAHLRQVVEIFLDNAMKYSAPKAKVTVTLQRTGRSCHLIVSNDGDPIEKAELTKLFKRFYRADPARSMNHSYGLGLSIAEEIIQHHHGKIWAESEHGVNSFHVQLTLQ